MPINPIDIDEFLHDTGKPEFHSVQTIEVGELYESGIFTWERVNWRSAAYSEEQYTRLCNAFLDRFWVREISITPFAVWLKRLHYMLVYELMPKYIPMYKQLEDYDPLQTGGEYKKERKIESDFPETLLNGNEEVYLSSGYDYESESVGRGNFTDDYINYVSQFRAIDAMILDEIDNALFSSLYTTNVNGW